MNKLKALKNLTINLDTDKRKILFYSSLSRVFLLLFMPLIYQLFFLIFSGSSVVFNPIQNLNDYWIRWDAGWYLNLINNGYNPNFPTEENNPECFKGVVIDSCQINVAFFPLFPNLIKGIHNFIPFIDIKIIGILVNNLLFIFASLLFYEITQHILKTQRLKRYRQIALYATYLFILSPLSFIFSGFMSESLFITLLLGISYFTLKKRWFLVGLLLFFISLTRSTGVFIIFSILIYYLTLKDTKIISPRSFLISIYLISAPIIAIILFSNHLYNITGVHFAFSEAQQFWRPILQEGSTFKAVVHAITPRGVTYYFNITIYLVQISLFFINLKMKIIPFPWSLLLVWNNLTILAGSIESMFRYTSVIFPIYIFFGVIIYKYREGKFRNLALYLAFIGLILMTIFYFQSQYITM